MTEMNRAYRRSFMRQAKKKGISEETAKAYIAARELGISKSIPPTEIHEGDKVKLNLKVIQNRQGYADKMSQRYRDFVEEHEGEIFTAYIDKHELIGLEEYPEWLFYSGDLILVDSDEV